MAGSRLEQGQQHVSVVPARPARPVVGQQDALGLVVIHVEPNDRDVGFSRFLKFLQPVVAGEDASAGLLRHHGPVEPVRLNTVRDKLASSPVGVVRVGNKLRDLHHLVPLVQQSARRLLGSCHALSWHTERGAGVEPTSDSWQKSAQPLDQPLAVVCDPGKGGFPFRPLSLFRWDAVAPEGGNALIIPELP